MKHQDALTAATSSYLETRPIAGKSIGAIEPQLLRPPGRIVLEFTVVEADLEQPVSAGIRRRIGQITQSTGALTLCIEQRPAVAVQHLLQVSLGGSSSVGGSSSIALMSLLKRISLA